MHNGMIEYSNGTKAWFLNGKLHREDGPAVEYTDGTKYWYLNNKQHREDGPAVECPDGHKEWFLNDEELTEEEFNNHLLRKWVIDGVNLFEKVLDRCLALC